MCASHLFDNLVSGCLLARGKQRAVKPSSHLFDGFLFPVVFLPEVKSELSSPPPPNKLAPAALGAGNDAAGASAPNGAGVTPNAANGDAAAGACCANGDGVGAAAWGAGNVAWPKALATPPKGEGAGALGGKAGACCANGLGAAAVVAPAVEIGFGRFIDGKNEGVAVAGAPKGVFVAGAAA